MMPALFTFLRLSETLYSNSFENWCPMLMWNALIMLSHLNAYWFFRFSQWPSYSSSSCLESTRQSGNLLIILLLIKLFRLIFVTYNIRILTWKCQENTLNSKLFYTKWISTVSHGNACSAVYRKIKILIFPHLDA